MRILNATETRAALGMADAIAAMRDAFGGDKQLPVRQLVGSSFFMPARVGRMSGVKVVATNPGRPDGIVAVFDEDGAPFGIVDGPTLTSIRTGAGCGLATDVLASRDASVFAMLGAGAMAADQILAVRTVRDVDVRIWSRSTSNAERMADEVGATVVASPDDAVAGASIITTATPSTEPLFDPRSVAENAHINAVGAFTPEMVEIPAETVRRAFVVVDDRAAAAQEAGDLIHAGVDPDAELGELVHIGERPSSLTMFKSVGIASQDVVAAATALRNARTMGIGTVTSR